MPDAFLSITSTNWDKSVVPLVVKKVVQTLRGGLAYTPAGSVIEASLVKGTNGTFRAFNYADLPEDGQVEIEDGSDADPDIEDLDISYIEFTGAQFGRTVGIEDTAKQRSPHNLMAQAVQVVARDIAVAVDNTARAQYSAAGGDLFAGTSNAADVDVAAGDNITADLLKDAVAMLRGTDVKPLANGLYAFVAHPYVIRDLMADDDFVDEMRHSDPATFLTGQVAKYAGAAIIDAGSRAIVNANAGTGSIDVYHSLLIGADSLFAALGGLQVIPVTGPDKSDPLNRRDLVSWKGFLGAKLNDIQENRYLNIASAASLGS